MIPNWVIEGQREKAPKGLWVVLAENRSTGEIRRMGDPAPYEEAIAHADCMNRSNKAWFYYARPILA